MNGGKDLKKNKLDWDYEEQEKFDQLYNAYSKLTYYIAFDVLKDESLAQDAVQEAFINISKSFSKIKEKEIMLYHLKNYMKKVFWVSMD